MEQKPEIKSSSCYCINLRRAANAVTAYYDRMLTASGLSVNQYSILSNIQKIEPCSVADLSRQVRLERTTLVRNLKALYAADWIYDEANPGNRKSRIHLTETGAEKVLRAKESWKKAQASLETHLGESTLHMLKETLLELEKLNQSQESL